MQHAKGIILFPWPKDAVKEEISLVYNDDSILKKTAFFMPPEEFFSPFTEGIWEKLRKEMKTYKIELPKYIPNGLVYNAFGIRHSLIGNLTSRSDFRAAIFDAMSIEKTATMAANPPPKKNPPSVQRTPLKKSKITK